jgi:hypothetical protein
LLCEYYRKRGIRGVKAGTKTGGEDQLSLLITLMDYEICKLYSCGCGVNNDLGIARVATLTPAKFIGGF